MKRSIAVSLIIGAVSAVIGWAAAVLLTEGLSEETFASLRFGWGGLMIGSIAAIAVVFLLLANTSDPIVTTIAAAAGGALLWNQREIPIYSDNLKTGTPEYYWMSVTMMLAMLALLFLGLRSANNSTRRAR